MGFNKIVALSFYTFFTSNADFYNIKNKKGVSYEICSIVNVAGKAHCPSGVVAKPILY